MIVWIDLGRFSSSSLKCTIDSSTDNEVKNSFTSSSVVGSVTCLPSVTMGMFSRVAISTNGMRDVQVLPELR